MSFNSIVDDAFFTSYAGCRKKTGHNTSHEHFVLRAVIKSKERFGNLVDQLTRALGKLK